MKILNMLMQKSSTDFPKRGQIFIADLRPSFGHEIHKKRPVLVISINDINVNFPTVVILPLSSVVPHDLGLHLVKVSSTKNNGLQKESVIVVDKIRSVDKKRLIKKIGKVSTPKLQEIEESLKLVLGLVEPD